MTMKKNNSAVSRSEVGISQTFDLPRLTFPSWGKNTDLQESLNTFVISRWPREDPGSVGRGNEVNEINTLRLDESGSANQKLENVPRSGGDLLSQSSFKARGKSDSPWYEPPYHRKRRGSQPIEESPPSTEPESTDEDLMRNLMGMETSGPSSDDTEEHMFIADKYLPDGSESDFEESLNDKEDKTDKAPEKDSVSELSESEREGDWDEIVKHDNIVPPGEEYDFWDEDYDD